MSPGHGNSQNLLCHCKAIVPTAAGPCEGFRRPRNQFHVRYDEPSTSFQFLLAADRFPCRSHEAEVGWQEPIARSTRLATPQETNIRTNGTVRKLIIPFSHTGNLKSKPDSSATVPKVITYNTPAQSGIKIAMLISQANALISATRILRNTTLETHNVNQSGHMPFTAASRQPRLHDRPARGWMPDNG